PDGSTVPLNDALDRGQADPRPGKFALAVEAAERPEQLLGVLHVEAGSVIPHEVNHVAVQVHLAHTDLWLSHVPSELPGVLNQVEQDDAQEPRVGPGKHIRLDL